ncbi:MAG TPA: hypothetical protein VF668_08985 [Pyrinomonadaceae bacterium]|jgi:hypothetical protein
MKKLTAASALLLLLLSLALSPPAAGQARGGWLRGVWEGRGFQIDTDSAEPWAMRLTARGGRYSVEYPSLDCGGRWRLVSLARRRAVFEETITRGAERCAPRGRFVVERLSARQFGFWYSHAGSSDYVASGILNRRP